MGVLDLTSETLALRRTEAVRGRGGRLGLGGITLAAQREPRQLTTPELLSYPGACCAFPPGPWIASRSIGLQQNAYETLRRHFLKVRWPALRCRFVPARPVLVGAADVEDAGGSAQAQVAISSAAIDSNRVVTRIMELGQEVETFAPKSYRV